MTISDLFERVKDVPIVDVMSFYGIETHRKGSGYVALCPFHADSHPSLQIAPAKNICKCFACGKKAMDPYGFVKNYEDELGHKIDHKEIVKILAQISHIPMIDGESLSYKPNPIPMRVKKSEKHAISRMDMKEVLATSNKDWWPKNPLYLFLTSIFDDHDIVDKVCEEYNLGTAKFKVNKSQGNINSVVFWQIDEDGEIRGGKIVPYNPYNGHRIKDESKRDVSWAHSLMSKYRNNYELRQCLFGQHLLIKDNVNTVSIVESEKTALIMRCVTIHSCQGGNIWLATGGKDFSTSRKKILEAALSLDSYFVRLYPDRDGYDDWCRLSTELNKMGIDCIVDTTIKNNCPEGSKLDIADLVIDEIQKRRNSENSNNIKLIKDKLKNSWNFRIPVESVLAWEQALVILNDIVPDVLEQINQQDTELYHAIKQIREIF